MHFVMTIGKELKTFCLVEKDTLGVQPRITVSSLRRCSIAIGLAHLGEIYRSVPINIAQGQAHDLEGADVLDNFALQKFLMGEKSGE
jgi:hypothetical protein